MIDIIIMKSGKVLAITDEVVVIGNSVDEIMENQGELPNIWLV